MAPKFGTSGLRGLVVELSEALIADHIRAFIHACPMGSGLYLARDLRPSSPAIAAMVTRAARAEGIAVIDCGAVATPALALIAMQAGGAAVMITGSHIPADRNGLKFYRPDGEISKTDEAAILAALGRAPAKGLSAPLTQGPDADGAWSARMVQGFGALALQGLRIGVWSHSAVSRDLLLSALPALGAKVIELGRSDQFIPVDTEAVSEEIRAQLAAWVHEHRLDAVISTDGDGDRPLLADATGQVVVGDVIGQITARLIGAQVVVTPVSSNTGVELSGQFAQVIRTKIGSPFVIAGMQSAGSGAKVVGYEANGGFLLGFEAMGPAGPLPPLATRDSLLPLVAALYAAKRAGSLSARLAAEPARFTASDRLEHIEPAVSAAFLAEMRIPHTRDAFLASLGETHSKTDETDGLRWTLASGRVLHLRPSGNAPEFRIYVESNDLADAVKRLYAIKTHIAHTLG